MSLTKPIIIIFIIVINLLSYSINIDLSNLKSLKINSNFYVNDIAIYFNKAFLAIPRNVCYNNKTHPSLVEVSWRELNVIIKNRIYIPIKGQEWSKCSDLQNAVSLTKDILKRKLWILDKGNEFCPPKLMVYGILQNNFINNENIILDDGIVKNKLNTIIFNENRLFIGNIEENKLLVCYIEDSKCTTIQLIKKENTNSNINPDFLSISKVDSTLFITSLDSLEIYALNILDISDNFSENDTALKLIINYCGNKLGLSTDIETDINNGIIYFLPRFYAIARWEDVNEIMQAEFHQILMQSSEKMPYVSRISTDNQGYTFALINPFNPLQCASDFNNNIESLKTLERIVYLRKFPWSLHSIL